MALVAKPSGSRVKNEEKKKISFYIHQFFCTNLVVFKLESFLVYFKTHPSTWVHHWLIKSESQKDAQQSLGSKCLLKFRQHCTIYWASWSGLESTTLVAAFLRKDWQSHAHICNSALPLSTIAPLCIFLEILESNFYFVLDRL